MVMRTADPGHPTRCHEEEVLLAIRPDNSQIVQYQKGSNAKKFSFPLVIDAFLFEFSNALLTWLIVLMFKLWNITYIIVDLCAHRNNYMYHSKYLTKSVTGSSKKFYNASEIWCKCLNSSIWFIITAVCVNLVIHETVDYVLN